MLKMFTETFNVLPEISPKFEIFILIILCLGLVVVSLKFENNERNCPPGPLGLPFVGYYPFLIKNPHIVLEKLRHVYGNIFGLYLGSHYVVFISDFDSLKEAYNKDAFLGRPPIYLQTSSKHKNFGEMSNYRNWFDHRRFAVNTLGNLGMGRNRLEELMIDELTVLLSKMSDQAGKPTVCIRDTLTPAVNNVILRLILVNKSLDENDEFMKHLTMFTEITAEFFSNTSAIFYYPWLRPILQRLSPKLRTIGKCFEVMETYVRNELVKHELNFDENNLCDYMDYYLNEMKKQNSPVSFTKGTLVSDCMLLLMAGSHTLRNTLEWSLLIMAKYPQIQEKVFQQINQIIGSKTPSWNDKVNLPYVEAVILEMGRWKTMGVLNCLRQTTEDTVLKGYDIPKGTIVMNNVYACHMNPEEWIKPHTFNPDRFLSADKSKVITPVNHLVFSYGRRDCPASKMAKMETFLFFTALMQKFIFMAPEDGLKLDSLIRLNNQALYPFVKYRLR